MWLVEAPTDGAVIHLEDAVATLTGTAAEGLGTRMTFAPRDRDPEALLLQTTDGKLLRWSPTCRPRSRRSRPTCPNSTKR